MVSVFHPCAGLKLKRKHNSAKTKLWKLQTTGRLSVFGQWVCGGYWFALDMNCSFIHSNIFYSASSSPLLLRGAPDYSINTVLELTRQSTTGNREWRTCQRSLRGGESRRIRTYGHKAPSLPLSHHAPHNAMCYYITAMGMGYCCGRHLRPFLSQ